jgi:hypothetical protein
MVLMKSTPSKTVRTSIPMKAKTAALLRLMVRVYMIHANRLDKWELSGVAQTFYDAEIAKRHLTPDVAERPLEHHSVTLLRPEDDEEERAATVSWRARRAS